MPSKAAQRQANYREYFARASKQVEEALANQDPEQRKAYVEEFQRRMDVMFTGVPSIADSWQRFVVGANEVTYRMTIDDPSTPQDIKEALVAEHREQLRGARVNWSAVILLVIVVLAIVTAIVMLTTAPLR